MVKTCLSSRSNDDPEIPVAAVGIASFCEENGLARETVFDINLVIDEVLTDTISDSYDDNREHRIDLLLRLERDMLVVEITGDGRPFDPSQMPDTDTRANLESRPIGDLGVFFVRKAMDGVAYRRDDGCNIVTLTKRATRTDVESPNVRRPAGVSLANSFPG